MRGGKSGDVYNLKSLSAKRIYYAEMKSETPILK